MATRDGTASKPRTSRSGAAGRAQNAEGAGLSSKGWKAAQKEMARGLEYQGKASAAFAKAQEILTPAAGTSG